MGGWGATKDKDQHGGLCLGPSGVLGPSPWSLKALGLRGAPTGEEVKGTAEPWVEAPSWGVRAKPPPPPSHLSGPTWPVST